MSKIKELERMLLAATAMLSMARTRQEAIVELDTHSEGVTLRELLKWRKVRRQELAGTRTIKAKVVTKVVEKDREKKDRTKMVKREKPEERRKRNEDVHKIIKQVIDGSADNEHLTKGQLLDATVFTSRYTKYKVVGVVRRKGERCVKLGKVSTKAKHVPQEDPVIPVRRLHRLSPDTFQVMSE